MRKRITAFLAVAALGAGTALAPVTAQASSDTSPVFDEIQLSYNSSWCITEKESDVAGAPLVLGKCANAGTQLFGAYETDYGFFIENSDGLCITVPNANGAPDGQIAEMGNCTEPRDVSQIFDIGDGNGTWVMPDIKDKNGNNIALDDKGDVLKAYNPIDTSYYCPTCHSELWAGPTWYQSP
jgi:hypothetical protein